MKQPSKSTGVVEHAEYVRPRVLAKRWDCSRSSVDRIAARHHFMRVCLGEGANGMIRYRWKEVEAYEASRQVRMS